MAQRRADWRVGVYVRVHGHLRSFENKKSMVVFSLKVIHDFNEVSQNLVRPISAYTLPVAVKRSSCMYIADMYTCMTRMQLTGPYHLCLAGVFPLSAVHLPARPPGKRTVTTWQHGKHLNPVLAPFAVSDCGHTQWCIKMLCQNNSYTSDMYVKHDACNDGTTLSLSFQDFKFVGHHISAEFMLLQAEWHEHIIVSRCSWC